MKHPKCCQYGLNDCIDVLAEEQDRNNRISNENNALNSRIKNYQEELLEREKDIERLRESRKKMEVELEHEKANTKVCQTISIIVYNGIC